jgi:hypothetical protein
MRTNKVKAKCHPDRPHYALGLCGSCYKTREFNTLSPEKRTARLKYISDWQKKHPRLRKRALNRSYEKLKREVFEHYGLECFCCGENFFYHLTIDHPKKNGSKERRRLGISGGSQFFHWLRSQGFPPGYRTACYQCNCTRGFHGQCNPKHKGYKIR